MDIFKLVGSIFIKNQDADKSIDDTASKAKSMSTTIGSAMETAGKKITGIGKALAPISVAVGGILTASVKGASDFQNGMSKMSTLFDTGKHSVQDLSKEFLDLSNKTGISATELAEAGYQALSAGQTVDTVGKFIETAGNLAKAGFTSTTTAVDVLTTAMNAYGEEAGTADQIANKLVRTQNLGKTTVDELASSMGKIIPTASSMGVNIDNLTSGYVSLTKQGIATAEATTYMNSMLNELGDSGTDLGGIIKEKTGKSFQDLMSEGYSLADVLKITKDYADENGIAYNELWGSAEAGKAGLAILNGGVEEFNGTVKAMESNVDDVGQALDKLETPSVKVQKSINKIKNSGIQLGTAFMASLEPALDKVSSGIEKATSWFSGLDDETKTTIATVMAVVAALSPVLLVGGKVIAIVGKIIPNIKKLKSSLTVLKGGFAALSSPVGIIIVAIGLLVAAFVLLYKKNEDFRTKVKQAWEEIRVKIKSVVDAVKGFIEAAIERIRTIIQTLIDFAKSVWEEFGDDIINILTNIFDAISQTIQFALDFVAGIFRAGTAILKGDWTTAWTEIKNLVTLVWNAIKKVVQTNLNLIRKLIDKVLKVIKKIFTKVWNEIKKFIQKTWQGIKDYISKTLTNISKKISDVWNNIKTKTSTILNNTKDKIANIWTAIYTKVTGTITTLRTRVSTIFENIKDSVSTKLTSIKDSVSNKLNSIKEKVSSILSSIQSKVSEIWNTIKTTVTNVLGTIKSTVAWKFGEMKNTVSNTISSIQSKISSGFNSAKNTVSSIFSSIKSKIKSAMDGAKSAVSSAVDKIKSKMKFHWSLPKLKLPHISITGKFSINPPSAPHFSIKWYKKAMENPFLMTHPTAFGFDPKTGKIKAGGEAGNEILYGHKNLMEDIRTASGSSELIKVFGEWMEKVYKVLVYYLPQVANMQLVTDTGALVGEITPMVDRQLGITAGHKGRGN